MISQKAARVSGPTANSRRDGTPLWLTIAQSGLIDPREASVEQASHRRIGGGEGILDDPGAIDDGPDLHALDSTLTASAVAYPGAACVRLDASDLCGHQGQMALMKRMRNACFHLGRHAMAMHVPPGARMFEEAAFGSRRQLAPEALYARSETVD